METEGAANDAGEALMGEVSMALSLCLFVLALISMMVYRRQNQQKTNGGGLVASEEMKTNQARRERNVALAVLIESLLASAYPCVHLILELFAENFVVDMLVYRFLP